MAESYSTSLKLTLIGDGDLSGTWGDVTNINLGTLLEQAICGVQTIAMGDTNQTLTNYNGVANQARNAVIVATGANTAVRQIVCPLVPKLYIVNNQTSGGYAITVGGSTGSVVTIPNSQSSLVYCDGVNFYQGITVAAAAATTVAGGLPNQILYQQATGNTQFISAPTSSNTFLEWTGSAFTWGTVSASLNVGTSTITGGTSSYILYNNGGVLGNASTTGSGSVVLSTSPTLVSPALGSPSSGNFTSGSFTWPIFNQNTTGTAANVSGIVSTSNGGTGSTSLAGAGIATVSANNSFSGANTFSGINTFTGTYNTFNNTLNVGGLNPYGYSYVANWGLFARVPGSSNGAALVADASQYAGSLALVCSIGATSSGFVNFAYGSFGTPFNPVIGSISQTGGGTGTAYNTTSDRRLKTNIVDYSNSGAVIDAIKPRSFTWIKTGLADTGFIADEIQQVIPNAVNGEPNAVDENGNPKYQALDCSTPEMIANIIAELQSLRKRVAALEAK